MIKYFVVLGIFAIYTRCDIVLNKVQVNLDLPPEQRWVDVCLKNEEKYRKLIEFSESAVIPKPLIGIVNTLAKHFNKFVPSDLVDEMKGMANTLRIDPGVFALFNIMYDVTAFDLNFVTNQYSGCTGIVVQDSSGQIWHARNLDYGQVGDLTRILRNMTLEVEFVRNGEVAFTASTYAGLVGVFTGQRPKQFTLTINQRDEGSIFENLEVLLTKNYTFTSVLGRQVMEDADDFDDAVTRVSKAVTPAPSYFVLGGTKPGQGAVVTRNRLDTRDVWRLNTSNGTWFLVETNYDHWEPTPSGDNRREVAIKALQKLGQSNINSSELFDILSIYPVLNSGTTYTTVMSAAQPDIFNTTVRDYTQ